MVKTLVDERALLLQQTKSDVRRSSKRANDVTVRTNDFLKYEFRSLNSQE